LADLFLVLILSVDLVLEILLKRGILLRDLFELQLKALHFALLLIQCVLELTELLDLLSSRFFHLLIYQLFAFHQLVIFLLQILEPVLQCFYILELPLLSRPGRTSLAALILNDGFEEVVEFF
jgi:hypothetical protein